MSDARRLEGMLRTAGVAVTDFVPFVVLLSLRRVWPQPSTTTAEGLAVVRRRMSRTLQRLGIELETLGEERLPREGGVLLMWNQESHLDHLVLGAAIPKPFFSLYNNEVARFPFYGSHMRESGHVHVDRNDEQQWRQSVAAAAERIRAGEWGLVSPEGTRSKDGRLLPMKRGAFMLARGSERPIVCVTLIGGHARLPRGAAVVLPGPIRVLFSDPIPTADQPEDDLEPLKEKVRSTFEALKAQHAS